MTYPYPKDSICYLAAAVKALAEGKRQLAMALADVARCRADPTDVKAPYGLPREIDEFIENFVKEKGRS